MPVEGWPKIKTCFEGIDRDDETESRILDQRSCGGASGDSGRELLSILVVHDQARVAEGDEQLVEHKVDVRMKVRRRVSRQFFQN